MVPTILGAALAPFADGLGADAVAFGKFAGGLGRASDFGTHDGCGSGIGMDLIHGADLHGSFDIRRLSMIRMFRTAVGPQAWPCGPPPPAAAGLTAHRRSEDLAFHRLQRIRLAGAPARPAGRRSARHKPQSPNTLDPNNVPPLHNHWLRFNRSPRNSTPRITLTTGLM